MIQSAGGQHKTAKVIHFTKVIYRGVAEAEEQTMNPAILAVRTGQSLPIWRAAKFYLR